MWYIYPLHNLGTKGKRIVSLGLVLPVLTFGKEKKREHVCDEAR